ncbi:hypothetical protein DYQ05_11775 [Treponema pedis]|nr:hypothetical protein DYQ05_11775 [Treponema pedis]
MKIDIRKSVQYKYILYRFNKKFLKNETLKKLSQEEKDKICIEVAKKTRNITLIFGIIYIFVMLFLFYILVINPQYQNNTFVKWYRNILDSVYPLINGNWGSGINKKRGTVLLICIKLLPIFIINAVPLLIFIPVTANILLKRRYNFGSQTGLPR